MPIWRGIHDGAEALSALSCKIRCYFLTFEGFRVPLIAYLVFTNVFIRFCFHIVHILIVLIKRLFNILTESDKYLLFIHCSISILKKILLNGL